MILFGEVIPIRFSVREMSNNQICGYVSLLYSVADKPLGLWSKHISLGGRVRRVRDDALHGDKVIEIIGSYDNSVPTSITAPANTLDALNVKLPVLVLVLKNLNLPFKFEIQVYITLYTASIPNYNLL